MPSKNIRLDKDGVKVVRFFMEHPEREMTSEEISKGLAIDEVDAGIILNGLEKLGFLTGAGKGLTYKYRISENVTASQVNLRPDRDDNTRYIG
jgi:hypothetical protein